MSLSRPNALAIDAGGSTCRAALIWNGVRHEVSLGPANVTSNEAGALATIKEALREVTARAGVTPVSLSKIPAYFALAGIVSQAQADALKQHFPLENLVVEDDQRAAVIGALGDVHGAVAAIGTGSFFAKRSDDGLRLVGGWGLVLGDEASGAWLGRALLTATLQAVDELRAHSPLTRETLANFEGRPSKIVGFARNASPADFARLAPQVLFANDDPTAVRLLRTGAAHIEDALAGLEAAGEPLCLIGGIGPHYAPYLKAETIAPKGSGLDGALALCFA